jgi:putative PIN family toxin of toxin-antitoxin system
MLPLKLVLDTNVVVSALLKPKGLERAVLDLALASPAQLFLSTEIFAEYRATLAKPKLKLDPAHVASVLRLIRSRSKHSTPSQRLTVCRDPDDNKFLECAEHAAADFLVTGNLRHFPASWKSTRIVNAREFTDAIGGHLG